MHLDHCCRVGGDSQAQGDARRAHQIVSDSPGLGQPGPTGRACIPAASTSAQAVAMRDGTDEETDQCNDIGRDDAPQL
jgi:hypothetical protein